MWLTIIDQMMTDMPDAEEILVALKNELLQNREPLRRDIMKILGRIHCRLHTPYVNGPARHYYDHLIKEKMRNYTIPIYINEGARNILHVAAGGSRICSRCTNGKWI